MKERNVLSIIIPTFNEEKNIERLFREIKKTVKTEYEIIIADSSSTDNTIKNVGLYSKKYKIKARAFDTGKTDLSNAIISVVNKAKGNIICVMDADLQHPPKFISRMLIKMIEEKADIVSCSRFLEESKIELTPMRVLISKLFIFLSHIVVPKSKKFSDPSTGFFMFKKEIVKNAGLNPIGFKILLEIIAKTDFKKSVEIPFEFKKRESEKSKANAKQAFLFLKHLLRLSRLEWKKWFKFIIVGASCAVLNEFLLWFFTDIIKFYYLVSGGIAIEFSIIYNFILNDSWTFREYRKGSKFKRFLKFNLSRLIAISVNLLFLWLLTLVGLHYLLSNLIGIIIATIISYLTSIWWVWK